MATNPSPAATSPGIINIHSLSVELVALICEHLLDFGDPSIHAFRRTSTRFHAIATPVAYKTLDLRDRTNAPVLSNSGDPNLRQIDPRVLEHISLHTRHVVVSDTLNPFVIGVVLSAAVNLTSVRWLFDTSVSRLKPVDFLDAERMRNNKVKLHVERLPLYKFRGAGLDAYLDGIPMECLTSLKLSASLPALTTRPESLKRLLLRSPDLKTFHYRDQGQGTHFQFAPGERFPPFTDIVLESYAWNHSRQDVVAHWDFSGVQSLRLISMPVFNFLQSVSFDDFSSLRALEVEDFSAHLPDRRHDATAGLYLLVRNHIEALEHLEITCHVDSFPLDAIAKHSASLRTLKLRDHIGFGNEHERCPTLSSQNVLRLANHLPYLQSLELDMDSKRCDDPRQFLHALGRFQNLRLLTLHVQTVLEPFDPPPGGDPDYQAAMSLFGVVLQSPGHLKRVTLTVGGWQRVMVRRLSDIWRERNRMGVFAERCFVANKNVEGGVASWEVREIEADIA